MWAELQPDVLQFEARMAGKHVMLHSLAHCIHH